MHFRVPNQWFENLTIKYLYCENAFHLLSLDFVQDVFLART